MRGAWIGFTWGHGQAHFFRAILESIAYEYAYYLGILRDAIPGLELTETRAVGGGARSNLWNQLKADVLGVPYQRLGRSEFGTWGAAMVAGKAAGIFPDLAKVAGEHAKPAGEPLRPQAENEAIYRPLIKQYIRLQESLRDAFVKMDKFKEND
jgi:xylulokinase